MTLLLARLLSRALLIVLFAASYGTSSASAQVADAETQGQVEALIFAGQADAAEFKARELLKARTQRHGADSAEVGVAENLLGLALLEKGAHKAALGPLRRASANIGRAHGTGSASYGHVLTNLARAELKLGEYKAAETNLRRALAIHSVNFTDSKTVALVHASLGDLYSHLGRYDQAERYLSEAAITFSVAVEQDKSAQTLVTYTTCLVALANLWIQQGQFDPAGQIVDLAIRLTEEAAGPESLRLVNLLGLRAAVLREKATFVEAESELQRGVVIARRSRSDLQTSFALGNLAIHLTIQARYAEADGYYQQAIVLMEKAYDGDEPPALADLLMNYVMSLEGQAKYDGAIKIYPRIMRLVAVAFGDDHPRHAHLLASLARLQLTVGANKPAEENFLKALEVVRRSFGEVHPDVAAYRHNIAVALFRQHRLTEAAPYHRQAIETFEKVYGPDHPMVATALAAQGQTYSAERRFGEARQSYDRALRIREAALGPDHPLVGDVSYLLGKWHEDNDDAAEAMRLFRHATHITIRNVERSRHIKTTAAGTNAIDQSVAFSALLRLADHTGAGLSRAGDLAKEMLETAQKLQMSQAAASLSQLAARMAVGQPTVEQLVRELQNLSVEWQERDKQRTASFGSRFEGKAARPASANNARLAAIDARIAQIEARLAKEAPAYSSLTHGQILSAVRAQSMLSDGEALVKFLEVGDDVYVWALTRSAVQWLRLSTTVFELKGMIFTLRCGLDAGLWLEEATDLSCQRVTAWSPQRIEGNILYETLPFDPATAHTLYKRLFGDIEKLIAGKHLLVVPSVAMSSLPLQVLISEAPRGEDYRMHRWLVRTNAVSVLPAVSSLAALHEMAKPRGQRSRMVGFGNPLLQGSPDNRHHARWAAEARAAQSCSKGTKVAALVGARPTARMMSNMGGAALRQLREMTPLPDTAGELCASATALGESSDNIFLAGRATETALKALSASGRLEQFQVVHFATHGAMAGDLDDVTEPGLVLTPPTKPSSLDDGYLSASELAKLRLNADWVILSACNTAAGDGSSAEALSGLARAVFIAGGRALLVSHWAVSSLATTRLVTSTVTNLPKSGGRAEAFRAAMETMISSSRGADAHPAFWAAFVLVGEGRKGR